MQLQEQWALVWSRLRAGRFGGARCGQRDVINRPLPPIRPGSWLHRTADAHAGLATLLLSKPAADAIPAIEAAPHL
ncbi:MAG: hypothetical protein R3E79_51995 [Caldilineaceae bacterium]